MTWFQVILPAGLAILAIGTIAAAVRLSRRRRPVTAPDPLDALLEKKPGGADDPQAVAGLASALRTADASRAPRIADALARHGDAAVEPMIALLGESEPHHARAWAAGILGELRATRAFPMLVRALDDLDDEVRSDAAQALGRLGDRRAAPFLIDHMLLEPVPRVRARIASALGELDDPDLVQRLAPALANPSWWVRLRGVEALEQLGSAAEGPLLTALADTHPDLRVRAAAALEHLGLPARALRMIEDDDGADEAGELLARFAAAGRRDLLVEYLRHPSPAVRFAVVEALQRAERRDLAPELIHVAGADPEPALRAAALGVLRRLTLREAVPAALAGIRDPEPAPRVEAVTLLGELGGPAVADAVRTCAGDPEPAVRAAAARALGRASAASATAEFTPLLTDPDPIVRAAAAAGVAEAGLIRLAAAVTPLLYDDDQDTRVAAAQALGHIGSRAALAPLGQAFAEGSPELREAVAGAVGTLDEAALWDLFETLRREGGEPAGRIALASALGALPSETARRIIGRLLRDSDEAVRAGAVNAAIRLGDTRTGPQVMELLARDSSPLVRERAALALGLLPVPDAERALAHACGNDQPPNVRAAAVLSLGAFGQESIAGRIAAMTDDAEVRDVLQHRLRDDAEYRMLGQRLRHSHGLELRAAVAPSRVQMEQDLAEGMHDLPDPGARMRTIVALHSLHGEPSRAALLQAVRTDPSPELRAAALRAVADMLEPAALADTARQALADPDLPVRRVAVSLFHDVPAADAIPALMQTLRADDDTSVMQMAAAQVAGAFDQFAGLALDPDIGAHQAAVAAGLACHLEHPLLPEIVAALARHEAPSVRAAVGELLAARPELNGTADMHDG